MADRLVVVSWSFDSVWLSDRFYLGFVDGSNSSHNRRRRLAVASPAHDQLNHTHAPRLDTSISDRTLSIGQRQSPPPLETACEIAPVESSRIEANGRLQTAHVRAERRRNASAMSHDTDACAYHACVITVSMIASVRPSLVHPPILSSARLSAGGVMFGVLKDLLCGKSSTARRKVADDDSGQSGERRACAQTGSNRSLTVA
jgi:hypothetical protein